MKQIFRTSSCSVPLSALALRSRTALRTRPALLTATAYCSALTLRSALRSSLFALILLFTATTARAQYIIHIAGNDSLGYYGDGLPALHSSLYAPHSICRDSAGNLYIGDGALTAIRCYRIRRIDATTGIITTIAGSMGSFPPSADSADVIAATSARFSGAWALCMDRQGNLLIADASLRVRKLNLATGIVTTVAGSPIAGGYAGDGGPATAARLNAPVDVAVDKTNNIYIADRNNNVIRKVNGATGIISTVAGNDTAGYNGDGGPATSAKLNQPYGICIDSSGNLYIADRSNRRVRRVSALTGIITTIAGTGTAGTSGDGGPATSALLSLPYSVALDRQQNLYVADGSPNYRIRRVDAATGIITLYAGNGILPLGVDSAGDGGPATAAKLAVERMCFDTCGNMYMGSVGSRIRAIVPSLPTSGTICGFKFNAVPMIAAHTPAELHISPSPNNGTFTIHLTSPSTEPAQITITDITGRVIKQLSITTNKETEVQLSNPQGLYFVNATTPTGRCSSKVVVQ